MFVSVENTKQAEGRTNSFCFDSFFVSILCLRSVFRQGTSLGSSFCGDSSGVFALRRHVRRWRFVRHKVFGLRASSEALRSKHTKKPTYTDELCVRRALLNQTAKATEHRGFYTDLLRPVSHVT